MQSLQAPKLASIVTTLTALLTLGTSGCALQFGEDRPESTPTAAATATPHEPVVTPPPPPPGYPAAKVLVEPGATVSPSPGQSKGVYVEVTKAGHWSVLTTCDTSVSDRKCAFDLNVSPEAGATFSGVTPANLATGDAMTVLEDGTVQIVTQTGAMANGLSFDTEPGALVEINVLVDGAPQPAIFHYVEGGVSQSGVPSNPVDFIPSGG